MVQHMDKWDWKKSASVTIWHQASFHPIFILGVFIYHYNNIAFFECQFVLIVCLTVVEGATFSTHHKIVGLQNDWKLMIAYANWRDFVTSELLCTCLGDGRIFLGRISPPDEERLWLLELLRTSPDSSDKESKLSVDCPVRMRFSGEDSSAKLWRGGEVSELPPDLGPTGKVVRPNLKIGYCFKWQEIVTEFVTDYDS